MSITKYEEKVERGLFLWLKEERGIEGNITSAWLDGTSSEDRWSGCDTCGYNTTTMEFDIAYQIGEETYTQYQSVEGDPLNFFPILLKFIDRAN